MSKITINKKLKQLQRCCKEHGMKINAKEFEYEKVKTISSMKIGSEKGEL